MTAGAMDWALGLLRRGVAEARNLSKATTGGGRRSGDPVEVYVAANELEALVVKGFLEANEIPVLLRSESLGTTLGVSIGKLAQVSVLVPEPLAHKALDLLESQVEASGEEGEELEDSPI